MGPISSKSQREREKEKCGIKIVPVLDRQARECVFFFSGVFFVTVSHCMMLMAQDHSTERIFFALFLCLSCPTQRNLYRFVQTCERVDIDPCVCVRVCIHCPLYIFLFIYFIYLFTLSFSHSGCIPLLKCLCVLPSVLFARMSRRFKRFSPLLALFIIRCETALIHMRNFHVYDVDVTWTGCHFYLFTFYVFVFASKMSDRKQKRLWLFVREWMRK